MTVRSVRQHLSMRAMELLLVMGVLYPTLALGNPLSAAQAQFDAAEYGQSAQMCEALIARGENAPARLLAATARVAEGHLATASAHLTVWARLTETNLEELAARPATPTPGQGQAAAPQTESPTSNDSMPIRVSIDEPDPSQGQADDSEADNEPENDEEAESEDAFMFWPDPTSMTGEEQFSVVAKLIRTIRAGLKKVEVRVPADARRPFGNVLELSYWRMVDGHELPKITVPIPQDWSSDPVAIRIEAGAWSLELSEIPGYERAVASIQETPPDQLTLAPKAASEFLRKRMSVDERLAYEGSLESFRAHQFTQVVNNIHAFLPGGAGHEATAWLYARALELADKPGRAFLAYKKLLALAPSIPDAQLIKERMDFLEKSVDAVPGEVIVKSTPPEARVFVVGKKGMQARTPARLHLLPGKQVVELRLKNHESQQATLTVKPAETHTVEMKLEPTSANRKQFWSLGLHVGAGASRLHGLTHTTIEHYAGPGLSMGIFGEWKALSPLLLRMELNYRYESLGFNERERGLSGVWESHFLELPLLSRYVFGKGFDALIGPAISARMSISESDENGVRDLSSDVSSILIDGVVGLGYTTEWSRRPLRFELRYVAALTNIAPESENGVNLSSSTWLVMLETHW